MKIRKITATPINLRLDAPYLWVFGELDGFSPTIVEVETDEGLTGLGEAPTPAAARIITENLAPALIGRDVFDIAGAEHVSLPFWTGVQSINDRTRIMAFGAIEMALWDLRGKAWNLPLYQLLGGAIRKDIPFTDYFSLRGDGAVKGEKTPEEVADTLRKALQFVDADKLYPSTNCGMAPLPRQVARGKLNALSAGAEIVRRELLAK